MWLECAVEVPLDASDITIGWFLNCQQLTSLDSRVNIQSQVELTDIRRIRSRLTINDLTEDYVGGYTCNILGDEEYIPSDLFMLPTSRYLEVDLALETACADDGDVYGSDAAGDEKCADITENITIPASLSCEAPPITSSQQIHVTSTPILLTTSPSPSLTSLSSHLTTTRSATSTNPYTNSPIPTTTVPSPSFPNTEPTSSTTTNSTLLYVVVAVAAVFFIVTLILTVVFIAMCVRCCRSKAMVNLPLKRELSSLPPSLPPSLPLPIPLLFLSLSLPPSPSPSPSSSPHIMCTLNPQLCILFSVYSHVHVEVLHE